MPPEVSNGLRSTDERKAHLNKLLVYAVIGVVVVVVYFVSF